MSVTLAGVGVASYTALCPCSSRPIATLMFGEADVVVIDSAGLLHARLKAAMAGADHELEFASGHQLDQESAGQVPVKMTERLLDDGDLRKLLLRLIWLDTFRNKY